MAPLVTSGMLVSLPTGTPMNPTRLLAACVVFGWLSVASATEPEKDVKALREAVLKADTPKKLAYGYKELFEKVGKDGLPELMKDDDIGLALQAAWEVHKKVVKRSEKEADDKWVYDPDELKKFVAMLKKRTKAPVPDWWAENITKVDVVPGKCHWFRTNVDRRPKYHETKDYTRWPDGHDLEKRDDTLVYTVGKRSIEFSKDTFEERRSYFAGSVGEKRSAIAAYGSSGPFEVAGFEGKGGKPVWKSEVWGAGRPVLAGFWYQCAEVYEKDGTVYVFGETPGGMYLEAFDLATGKCAFRFCTAYWLLYSEGWAIK